MSILRSKHSGWTHEGRRTPYFGGGGGGGPGQTTSTSYNTNIPEYARPYVETMLGATQKQLFDMDGSEITGFKPYQPYSTDPSKYVAGFQPLQEQAMQATGQLQTPGQFGDATALAGASGLGSLGLAGQAAGAGQQFAQQAQNPMAMQGYMSPYMQNVVDYQKAQAARDYNIGQGVRKAQAVGQGAFGGNRAALMEAEAQRSLTNQLQGIAATGSQKAFEDAQRQQQFGAQLGLQGIQAGLQGMGQAGQAAGTLGQLGGQQFGIQKDIIGMKSQMGAQQQALEQQKINQAIQDWANTQQYPLMQLGVMSNMLRGLPMQSTNTQSYVAAPNALTQGIGTIGAIGSLGNVFRGGKEGGLPSEFKPTTGIKSYNIGGSIKGKLYDMSPEDLRDYINETSSPIAKQLAEEVLRDKVGKASGGIIAFKDRGEVEDPEMVRKAYIEAAKLKQNEIPENLRYDQEKINLQNQLIKDVGSQLNRTPAPVLTRDAGGQGITEDVFKRIANRDFRGIANETSDMRTKDQIIADANKQNAGVQADPNLSKEDKARLQKRHDEGIAIVKADPNIGVKPPTAVPSAAAPAPAPAGITSATRTGNPELDKYIAATLAEANKPEKTIAEIAAERRAYIGPDEFTPKERARLMAEKANAKEEATRQNWMRMAEFFATWGSTPGNSIVAGLTALKNKVPDFISDDKQQKKILRDIDASITGLDKVERLEKAGEFDKASELKQKLSSDLKGKVGNVLTFAASNLTSQRNLQAAQIRADVTGGAGGENKLLARVEADIGREKKDPTYQKAFKFGNMPITKDTSPELKARIEAEKENLRKFEEDFERRRAQARGGKEASAAPAPPAAKPSSTKTVDLSTLPK
jgi:hypothetical protein